MENYTERLGTIQVLWPQDLVQHTKLKAKKKRKTLKVIIFFE